MEQPVIINAFMGPGHFEFPNPEEFRAGLEHIPAHLRACVTSRCSVGRPGSRTT